MITNNIIERLEEGTIPWKQPFSYPPFQKDVFKSTKEFLELETLALLCFLQHAR